MDALYDFAGDIQDKEGFIDFLELLEADFHSNKNEWDGDLERFLNAFSRFMNDSDQNRNGREELLPTWKSFAKILLAARSYE